MKWDDIDSFGNNCVHLAASGGNLHVFQCFMMLGVDVTNKNSRGHEVLDLSTNLDIIALVKAHKAALKCSATGEVTTHDKIAYIYMNNVLNNNLKGILRLS